MKTKHMVNGFMSLMNQAKKENKRSTMNGNILAALDIMKSEMGNIITKHKLNTEEQIINLFKIYHNKWGDYAKGVNYNLKEAFIRKDGFKIYCINAFPKLKEKIEESLL